jgi:hypothetical protein
MTMVPAQHFVPWKVFESQPTGQLVSAAVEMADSIVASRRALMDSILVGVVAIVGVRKNVWVCREE